MSRARQSPADELRSLRYEQVRGAESPERMLLEFLQSTYEAAAELAHWNRGELEAASSAA